MTPTVPPAPAAPKYRFCWWCSKQLRGPYGVEALTCEPGTSHGYFAVLLHRSCVDAMRVSGRPVEVVKVRKHRKAASR